MPVYRVEARIKEAEKPTVRLVEAAKITSVMRFVAEQYITITPATMAEAHELGKAGVELERVPE